MSAGANPAASVAVYSRLLVPPLIVLPLINAFGEAAFASPAKAKVPTIASTVTKRRRRSPAIDRDA